MESAATPSDSQIFVPLSSVNVRSLVSSNAGLF
jgi:hypothetical protein